MVIHNYNLSSQAGAEKSFKAMKYSRTACITVRLSPKIIKE